MECDRTRKQVRSGSDTVRTSTWWIACFILAIIAIYTVTSHNGRQRTGESEREKTHHARDNKQRRQTRR